MNSVLLNFRAQIPFQYRYTSREIRQKVPIYFERSKYIVKTIQTANELESVLQFRYNIFHREFQGKLLPFGIDWEPLDPTADHLVILDSATQQIVGTYRLISTSFSESLYSESEFDISDFLLQPGIKLELSRACIHRNYRNGIVLSLLWRGVCEYLRAVNAAFVFGCSSINTMDDKVVNRIISILAKKGAQLDYPTILPKENYLRKNRFHFLNQVKVEALPPLLEMYLKAGAKVSLHPAWDYDFHCADFFTVLKVGDMNTKFKNKYRC